MGKLKDFEITMKESAAHDAAEYIEQLENENEKLKRELAETKKFNELYLIKIRSLAREINELYDENDTLKNEIIALKNFIIKLAEHAANVYAEDVAESARLQKINYENDPYLNY